MDDEADKSGGGALGRGLRVLMALNDLGSATIGGLVAETHLPKPTVIRLLRTLMQLGFARHDTETGTYDVTPKVASLSRGLVGRGPAHGRVQEILDTMADRLKWPVELLIQDGGSMVVETNNRERAPIKLALFERRRFRLLHSAAGIAMLTQVPAAEQTALIARYSVDADDADAARGKLADALSRGYGHRKLLELEPNMVVSAVPIPGVHGALSAVYFEDVLPRSDFETRVLPGLRQGAAQVGAALASDQ